MQDVTVSAGTRGRGKIANGKGLIANGKWGRIRALTLPALIGALTLPALLGCGADRAERLTMQLGQAIGTALIEKSTITSTSAQVAGEINDPEYRFTALWVTGIQGTIGVRGLKASGSISGQGSGADKPLSPETLKTLRETLARDPSWIEKLAAIIEEARKIKTGTQPAGP